MKLELEINKNDRGHWFELSCTSVSIVGQRHYETSHAAYLEATRVIRDLRKATVEE